MLKAIGLDILTYKKVHNIHQTIVYKIRHWEL
jgi:hypothetical protein